MSVTYTGKCHVSHPSLEMAAARPDSAERCRRCELPLVPYASVHPHGAAERDAIRQVADIAAKDSSCPSCRDAAAAHEPRSDGDNKFLSRSTGAVVGAAAAHGGYSEVIRAGTTSDGRLPQPRCGVAALSGLDAPLFIAAERPRRLAEGRAPFGLRMNGKSTQQMLARIRSYLRNSSQPLRCRFATCAVVGNAGNLRHADLGGAIDAHEAVLRLNAAPTRGHEANVGRRTTWRVHNSEKPWFMAALDTPELQVAVCHAPWIGACQHQAFSGLYSANASLVNPLLYSQLWSLLGRPRGKQTPSTGLLAIALALGVCDHVSLYGFSKATDAPRCSHHYWDCPKWTETYHYIDPAHKYHDWVGEAALRDSWLRKGVVVDGAMAFGAGAAGAEAVRRLHGHGPVRSRT